MVVLSIAEYESLRTTLLKLIERGADLRSEMLADGRYSTIDFNSIQSLHSHLFVRTIKRKTSRFDYDMMHKIAEIIDSAPGESIRSIALADGYSPYKVAKMFLSGIYNMELSEFIEHPELISNESLRSANNLFVC